MVATLEQAQAPQIEDEKSAKTLMAEGRRDFICKDYSNAADNFSKACEKLTVEYGDRSAETAEGYFWYGKALLETSRNQNDFLGTKAENEDVENEDPDNEENGKAAKEIERISPVEELRKPLEKIEEDENKNVESDSMKAETNETETNENETNENETEETETNEAETQETATKEEIGSEDDEDEEDEEDVCDQQLAYEMFELARGIYETLMESTQATEINRAECHMSIGEISGENGQIEEAIVEYYSALDILEKKLPAERKRRLAEVYVSLGCSQDAVYQYSKSITSFERAIEIMEARVKDLKAKDEDSLKPADKREMTSLHETVIPELKERIIDAKNSEKKHEEDKELLKQVLLAKSTTSTFQPSTSSQPVTSINNLVKRKRKSGDTTKTNGILEPSSKK